MYKRIIVILFVLLICLYVVAFAEETKPEKTFCWKITSETGTVYLMGSLHFCTPDLYPLDRAITNAYEESEVLAVEADMNSAKVQTALQEAIMAKGVYSDGTGLEDHISEEGFKKFTEYCEERGLNLSQMSKLRPWLLSIQIIGMESLQRGASPEAGLDKHFLDHAKKEQKEVKELESGTFQIDMFSTFSAELQELLLIQTLD
jgi:uncharacterized protein YbaP (TraB family)